MSSSQQNYNSLVGLVMLVGMPVWIPAMIAYRILEAAVEASLRKGCDERPRS